MYTPHLRGRGIWTTSLRAEYLHRFFGILLLGRIVYFLHLLIYPTIYLYKYGLKYLFYTIDYNSVLFYLFCCSNYFRFSYWELFQLVPVSF